MSYYGGMAEGEIEETTGTIYRYVCPEFKKVLRSLYREQLEYQVSQHKQKHNTKAGRYDSSG